MHFTFLGKIVKYLLAPHVESFHKETSEEQLLPVFYEPATKDTPDAVFRTAAEISARLSFLGNIRQPMALSVLGRMLVQQGYLPIKLPGGKRGCFVLEHTNTQADIQNILKELEE